MERLMTLGIGLATLVCDLACATAPLGAMDADIDRARTRAATGALVYDRNCAGCHGARGEGLAGIPAVMGSNALPVHRRDVAPDREYSSTERTSSDSQRELLAGATRGPFRNARDVHGYLSRHMPKVRQDIEPPTDQEYWQVTSFLLVVNGALVPRSGVDPSNADSVPVKP